MDKEKNFISAVVYVHNDAPIIEGFIRMIINVLENNFQHSEIICVDDYSIDDSVDRIKGVSKIAEGISITILHMSHYHGLELSMKAGMDLAIGDFVYEFDSAESDYEPEEIMNVYRKSLEGYDIVSACPNKKQKFTSGLFYYLFDKFARNAYDLNTERFRVLSRRVINRVSSMNKTIVYRKAVYANCGMKTAAIVYETISQTERNMIGRDEKIYRKSLALDSLIMFTEVGYKFSIAMTVLMMVIAIFMSCYSIAVFIMSDPVAGWTTTILFLSVIFFGLFGILTIIIKYLQILVDLNFRRKNYNFESIEKIRRD